MSDLMNTSNDSRNLRRKLLTSVSALALLAIVCDGSESKAADNDADRPTVWIELGAQLEQVSGIGEPFNPPFTPEIISDGFKSPLELQRALGQSFGGQGKISFQPENSDWMFSASIRYGRANGNKSTHEQTASAQPITFSTVPFTPVYHTKKFSETKVSNSESHTILDFQVGKDIGLGLFDGGQSLFSFGVRFAQFTSKQTLGLRADPDFHFPTKVFSNPKYHHTYDVASHMDRSFRGLGPSVSWNASVPLIGDSEASEVTLDWGANAALLFGRQRVRGHHQTTGGFYKTQFAKYNINTNIHRSGNPDRSRSVVAPNLGGFAGVSWRFPNAKVSVGYRADYFFNAIDGGIDTRKSENLGFFGPFASISVGIGD